LKVGAVSDRSYLEEISIRGLGVIEEATLELSRGFTVLTGETGAGKTMVLTALSLVLGGKSESSLVRQGCERLVASATFSVPSSIADFVEEKGVLVEDDQLILTRSVSSQSKSKATAGGVSVPLSVLSEVSEKLIEIHAQSASMSITKQTSQRDILDRFGGVELSQQISTYASAFEAHGEMKSRIAVLRKNMSNREKEIADLVDFSEHMKKIQPKENEWSLIQSEIGRLESVEDLRIAVSRALECINSEEDSLLSQVHKARKYLEEAQGRDSQLGTMAEKVSESSYLLAEFTQEAASYLASLEADPNRLDFLQARKADLTTLAKKFAKEVVSDEILTELVTRGEVVKETIADLTGGEDRVTAMEKELGALEKSLVGAASKLSQERKDVALRLSNLVTAEIHSLSMPHTTFECEVVSPDYSKELNLGFFAAHGGDEVSMLLQAHSGGPLVSVAKGASGGELSRIMLALEVVLAQSQPVGTYIFDEVDAGVGGKAAIEVGRRLFNLSKHAQVIAITHLPQVAAWADAHFVVKKSNDGSVTQSDVVEVRSADRVEEIARMLAGHEDSRSAQEHATELLAMRG